jgi:flagellar assembly factor FliW
MNSQTTRSNAEPTDIRSLKRTPQILMDKVFHFPDGLPAFEEVRQFIFACKPDTAPFIFMRALEPAQLGFVCIDPFLICPGYKLDLSDADTAFLDIANPGEVMILSIVTPSPDVHLTTANLQSPLVINLRTCRGRQIIFAEQNYPVRYSIWEALKNLAREIQVLAPEAEGTRSAA